MSVESLDPAVSSQQPGPFRVAGFRQMFAAAAVSQFGTQVSSVAVPLAAVTALHAGPAQVGLLATLGTAAFLLVGLPAGAWVDALPHRPVMVAADLLRAALLGSVPLAWHWRILTLTQLYAVVLLTGVCTVFFDVASQSLLPTLLAPDSLTAANSALVSMNAVGNLTGRAIGGVLVQAIAAPAAVAVDAASYLWSAVWLRGIPSGRTQPASPARQPRLGAEIREGLRFVFSHPVLRPITLQGAITNLSVQLNLTILPVLFVRDLRLPAGALGAYLAAGGAGVLIGARLAVPVSRRLGLRSVLWPLGACFAPAALAIPAVARGPWLWLSAAAWLTTLVKTGINNVVLVSFRQRVTPDRLLGRVNATTRLVLTGALALGAGLAGLLGQLAGDRAVLWASACGLALAWLPVYFSPVRRMGEVTLDPPAA